MPRKRGLAYLLPFEDPDFIPDHPVHHQKPIFEDPYAPWGKRERKRMEEAQLAEAMKVWKPPHVVRSWEVDKLRGRKYHEILSYRLLTDEYDSDGLPTPLKQARDEFERRTSPNDSSATRRGQSPYDPERDPNHDDFRQFAVHTLHLGYHRFHASTEDYPGAEQDPSDLPEDQVCWIMEYTESECHIIRRQIAQIMGLFPAVCDPETTAFDDEYAFRYERRMQARCCRGNKRCIRPSHIGIYSPAGVLFP